MAAPLSLRGVYVPLVTPFDERGDLALESLQSLAVRALDAGATGLVALATTGESSALTADEQDRVVAACADVCGDRGAELIVGAATNDTATTIARHEALADVPATSASLAVVPYYVRPSEGGVVEHLRVVADHSPVPVVVYNIPYRTGRGLGADSLLELAGHESVGGVKQAVGGVDADTLRVLAESTPWDGVTRRGFSVLGGDDPFLFPVALMGGTGAIAASANVDTEEFVAMIDDATAGRLAPGRRRAEHLLPLAEALFAEPSPSVVKAVLHADGLIPTADVRLPLTNASPQALVNAQEARRS